MKSIQDPWLKLKEGINREDINEINQLQELCVLADQTALELELDYKLGVYSEKEHGAVEQINEFLYFDGPELIGYMGISGFGGTDAPLEVNGMVHPAYRRQGVFGRLSELVMAEWRRRETSQGMLLLSDRKSEAGQAFIRGTGASYHHSEYEMYLRENGPETNNGSGIHRNSGTQYDSEMQINSGKSNSGMHNDSVSALTSLTFRKANNADAWEIQRQNAIYFGDKLEEDEAGDAREGMIQPEEEEKRGMTIYLAELGQQIVGKVHIQLSPGIGGIYGLGVLPEYRGKGYGRAVLLKAIEKLKEANAGEIMLQVAVENANALGLYQSCGFVETSTMDYYELK